MYCNGKDKSTVVCVIYMWLIKMLQYESERIPKISTPQNIIIRRNREVQKKTCELHILSDNCIHVHVHSYQDLHISLYLPPPFQVGLVVTVVSFSGQCNNLTHWEFILKLRAISVAFIFSCVNLTSKSNLTGVIHYYYYY